MRLNVFALLVIVRMRSRTRKALGLQAFAIFVKRLLVALIIGHRRLSFFLAKGSAGGALGGRETAWGRD